MSHTQQKLFLLGQGKNPLNNTSIIVLVRMMRGLILAEAKGTMKLAEDM